MMMIALDAGADDVVLDEDVFEISTSPSTFSQVREALEANKDLKILSAEVSMVPQNYVAVEPEAEAKVRRLLNMLEEDDDVQNVYHNAELSDEDEDE